MLRQVKTLARNALAPRYQVPLKYWYGLLRRELEEELALLPALVRPGEHIIDVGGNRGTYAYAFWRLGARVEVFEPNPACASVLRGWAANKAGLNIHAVALSSEPGLAPLHVPVDADGTEHDASASLEAAPPSARDYMVPLRQLDSFGFTDTSLIKIDVEGHESRVLEGATATLAASLPALIVEIEQRHNTRPIGQVFKQIEDLGYNGFFLLDGKLAPLASFEAERHQSIDAFASKKGRYHNNFVFLGKERLGRGYYKDLAARWMLK